MSQTLITSTDPKGIRATALFHAKYNKARLDDDRAQRLNESAEFWSGIEQLIEQCSQPNQYANEEVRSTYAYPPEYKGPLPLYEQTVLLSGVLGLNPTDAFNYYSVHLPKLESLVPADALPWTNWFAVPSLAALDTIAQRNFPDVEGEAERYCRALLFAFGKLAASRSFQNWREGQIDPAHLRMSARLVEAMKVLGETQKGDILVIAAQLGMRHRGRSTRRAREVFVPNEYGCGSLMGASIALTHPKRFVRWEELDMDLPGDEFSPKADGVFSKAPILNVNDDRLKFDTNDVDNANENYGTASFFLPQ